MAFRMTRSSKDEQLLYSDTTNIVTLGRGSYTSSFDVSEKTRSHVLIGRFSSLAWGDFFLIGANHSMTGVTTSPFD